MILLVAMSVTCDLHVTYTYIFLIPFLSFWFVYLFASKSDAIPISVKLKRFHWTFGSNNLSRITYDRRGPVTTFHNSVYNVLHNDVGPLVPGGPLRVTGSILARKRHYYFASGHE